MTYYTEDMSPQECQYCVMSLSTTVRSRNRGATHITAHVEDLYLARQGMLSTSLALESKTELFAGSS